jgi:hypothetical protein
MLFLQLSAPNKQVVLFQLGSQNEGKEKKKEVWMLFELCTQRNCSAKNGYGARYCDICKGNAGNFQKEIPKKKNRERKVCNHHQKKKKKKKGKKTVDDYME